MKYFHRTALQPDDVLVEASSFFGPLLHEVERGERQQVYKGTIGTVRITVSAEGGHYTRITVDTDQVGESEIDRIARRFLGRVHKKLDPRHQLRGAY